MTLKTIDLKVADYMSPGLITIETSDSLTNAIDLMAEKGIGNLVVEKSGHVIGILTEREILEHLVYKRKIEGTMISDVPLSTFTMVGPETSIIDAARLMIARKTRLLVYDEKKLIGIITATDMVRAFRRTSSNPLLDNVISNTLHTVKEDDDIYKAVKMMHDKKIGSVIVAKHHEPYGIFTERDLLVNVLSYDADLKNPVIGYCSYPLVTSEYGIEGSDAARIMAENKIKRLVLTKQGKPFAIVTARDIVDAFQLSFPGEDF
jgi:predicted transcriptional regulator